MARKALQLDWRDGNAIDLLHNGIEFFPALCRAIDDAQRMVHLETYIFHLDETGRRVLAALQRASKRGVRVRVVIDGFGSDVHADLIVRHLTSAGVSCRVYRPRPGWRRHNRLTMRHLRRLHRKTAVIDDAIGFVGGINILDDFFDVPDDGRGPQPRFDFAVRLQGPVVLDVLRAQSALWLRMGWRRRDDWDAFQERLARWIKWRRARTPKNLTEAAGTVRAALLLRDNLRFRQKIERVYLNAIGQAQDEILIANAYFFPGRKIRAALADAAGRGVRVRLMLQGQPEYQMQYRASRYIYDELLAEGIELYEYLPSYLHAKVAVIDGCAMVGSANLDPFSSLLAREANVWIQDTDFAHQLDAVLKAELGNSCNRITPQYLNRRNPAQRALDAIAYLVLRVGVALTGKSSEY